MLEIDGIQPKLDGHICEKLICQQYWYNGKLVNEVDVFFIKADGRCYQLYFENGVVFWRTVQEIPQSFEKKQGDKFAYPLIDLTDKYQLSNQLITALQAEPMPEGAKVTIDFEHGDSLVIYHQNDHAEIRHTGR